PFFRTWELKGGYPRIFEDPKYGEQARQVFDEANVLLDRLIRDTLIRPQGVYAVFLVSRSGDEVELYTGSSRDAVLERFHFLRQQRVKSRSEPHYCLSDFVAPKDSMLPDHVGAFAVTSGIGLGELCDSFRKDSDDYNAIMAEALADR